jgi:hypothetical protein
MIRQRPDESHDAPQTPPSIPVLDPRDTVEVASAGPPPVNDPAGKDTQPPGFEDLSHFL